MHFKFKYRIAYNGSDPTRTRQKQLKTRNIFANCWFLCYPDVFLAYKKREFSLVFLFVFIDLQFEFQIV